MSRKKAWSALTPPAEAPKSVDAPVVSTSTNADNTVTLKSGKVELGQGILTALAQIAADGLGLPVERVEFRAGHSDHPDGGVAGGSGHTATAGSALFGAGSDAVARLAELAAAHPESPLFGAGNAGIDAIESEGLLENVRRVSAYIRRTCMVGPVTATQGEGFLLPDLVTEATSASAEGRPMRIGDLSTSRDYTDVRDVARGVKPKVQHYTPTGVHMMGTCLISRESGEPRCGGAVHRRGLGGVGRGAAQPGDHAAERHGAGRAARSRRHIAARSAPLRNRC